MNVTKYEVKAYRYGLNHLLISCKVCISISYYKALPIVSGIPVWFFFETNYWSTCKSLYCSPCSYQWLLLLLCRLLHVSTWQMYQQIVCVLYTVFILFRAASTVNHVMPVPYLLFVIAEGMVHYCNQVRFPCTDKWMG